MRYLHFFCMAGLLLLCSCGGKFFPPLSSGGTNPTTSGNYLYVANSGTSPGTVAGFSIANSTLSALSGSPYTVSAAQPVALAITPKNTFLYAGSTDGGIYVYIVNSNGTLTIGNNGSAVNANMVPSAMKVDTTGNWLIAVQNTGSNALAYVFAINTSTGVLTSQGAAVTLDIGSPNRIAITPSDQLVYVSLGSGGVDILSFTSSSGVLTPPTAILHPLSSNNADQGLAIDPTGTYLFVTETGSVVGTNNGLRVLKIAANGSLSELSTSPVQTPLGPSAVLVSSNGSYVYVTNTTANNVSGFALTANGALTALPNSPYSTGQKPLDLAEDNTHAYVAVVCSGGTPDMQVFKIDTTNPGQLDAFATSATGTAPTGAYRITATN